jgi:prepilin-type N-terminal cleavage/methylation domain-containing protein
MSNQKGFTLVELLLVLAIFTILFAIVGTISLNSLPSTQLNTQVDQLESMLRKAQARSVSRHADSLWGVHLTSANATLFAGSSYAGRDAAYDEGMVFPSGIIGSGLTDVIFQYRTGATSTTGTITLTHSATGGTRSLTINSTGSVGQ